MGDKIKTIVVDDDNFIVESLKTILNAQPDIEFAGGGTSGSEVLNLYEEFSPDVVLTDIQMPGTNGLEGAEQLLKKHPNAKVLFLSTFSDEEYIVHALKIGSYGYLIKQDVASIAPAIRSVAAGQRVLGDEVMGYIEGLFSNKQAPAKTGVSLETLSSCETLAKADSQNKANKFSDGKLEGFDLTPREKSIVIEIGKGFDNSEIAKRLYLSEGTVRNNISNILTKLGLKNRTQIAIFYYQN